MGTGSSVYIKKNTMVTELAEIITETAKILEQLNEARKTKDIKMISNKVDMLEAKYGNIPFGSILPEIPITIS